MVDAYDEEVIVRQAHQETEIALNEVALELKGVTAQGLCDIEGLFGKLGTCFPSFYRAFLSNFTYREEEQCVRNHRKVVLDNQKLIQSGSRTLVLKLGEMSQLSQSLRTSLEQETENFFTV